MHCSAVKGSADAFKTKINKDWNALHLLCVLLEIVWARSASRDCLGPVGQSRLFGPGPPSLLWSANPCCFSLFSSSHMLLRRWIKCRFPPPLLKEALLQFFTQRLRECIVICSLSVGVCSSCGAPVLWWADHLLVFALGSKKGVVSRWAFAPSFPTSHGKKLSCHWLRNVKECSTLDNRTRKKERKKEETKAQHIINICSDGFSLC